MVTITNVKGHIIMNKQFLVSRSDPIALHGISVNRMIIYGSHAHDNPKADSDIDIAVISNSFKKLNILKRLEMLGTILARARIMAPIEALGYTEAEYRNTPKGAFLADEIKAKGKILDL